MTEERDERGPNMGLRSEHDVKLAFHRPWRIYPCGHCVRLESVSDDRRPCPLCADALEGDKS